MLNSTVVRTTPNNDANLVRAILAGNRDAFGEIVARYQGLICALTYSATGNLGQSEDLAQETFITAWKQLADLQEPEKLRSWLCGIARNLANNSRRKQKREPSHAAEPIENVAGSHSLEPLPVDHTMSNEEQAILWRSLEKIPETYREPLILFYREHQSVETVAEKLALSAETVHQRLSRGRKILAEEVTAFIEGALTRTNPGQAFTIAVLAALPVSLASSAKAAAIAVAAAKGGAVAKGTSLAAVFGLLFSPLLGFFAAFLGARETLKLSRTPRERTLTLRYWLAVLACGILFFVACSLFSDRLAPRIWGHHPVLVITLGWVVCLSWPLFLGVFMWRYRRIMFRSRAGERASHPELFRDELPAQAWEYKSRATLLGLPLVHWRWSGRMRDPGEKVQPAVGWIAVGERAYGILSASGGLAVGCISNGVVSLGLLSFGGLAIGLFGFGAFALGAIAMGGGAVGWIASGGLAFGWHAAMGGIVAAHDLACGGTALANHVNDSVARIFYTDHHWLDLSQAGPMHVFWVLCFGPMLVQMIIWAWWRRKVERRAKQN